MITSGLGCRPSTVTALLKKQLRSDEGTFDFLIMRPTVFIKNVLADFYSISKSAKLRNGVPQFPKFKKLNPSIS